MKRFSTLTVIVALTMIISACGAEPVPTVNPVDVQNTAIAAAFTMVAQTQAAIPSATPLPPTEAPTQTPLATNTQLPLPTLNATLTTPTTAAAAVVNTPSGDPCDTRVLSHSPLGKPTKIRIW